MLTPLSPLPSVGPRSLAQPRSDGFPTQISQLRYLKVTMLGRRAQFALAIGAVLAAAAIRAALTPVVGGHGPLAIFVLPTLLMALVGGVAPALLAALLGSALGPYLFLASRSGDAFLSLADQFRLGEFVLTNLVIVGAVACLRPRVVAAARTADESARMLHAIINTTPHAIIATDRLGRVTAWNAAATSMFGWRADEVLGTVVPAVPPESFDEHRQRLAMVLGGGTFLNHPITGCRRDGTRLACELSMRPIHDNGDIVGMLATVADISDKRAAEDAARQAAAIVARDAYLLSNVRDSVIVTDLDGVITYWNDGAERLFGWTAGEVIGRPMIDRYPAGHQARIAAMMAKLAAGEEFAGEFEDYRKDGSRIWIETRVSRIHDADGRPAGFMGVAHDISARKRAEAERDCISAQLQIQIERMPLGYLLLDADLTVVGWNSAAEQLFGYTRDEVLGMRPPFAQILAPTARLNSGELLERLKAGDMAAHGVNDNLTKDGRIIRCQWHNTPLFDGNGAFLGVVSLAQDITEQAVAEEALRASEERFRQIAESISEVFWLATPAADGLMYVSPAYESIWGRSRESLYQQPQSWLDAIHGDDRDRIALATRTKQDNGTYDEEYRILRPDGSIRWIRDRAFPVRIEHDGAPRVAGVAEDITERRMLEDQLRQAQKMEAVGQLAGGVAHDFNNLLTVINGYSEMLLTEETEPEQARELIGHIRKAGERSAALTRQLLALSRQQVLAPKVVDVNAIVRDTEKMLRRLIGEDIDLTTNLPAGLWRIKADPSQLEQVLLNLAVNARDAMPEGGRLAIETRNVVVDDTNAATAPGIGRGRHVMVSVRDSGSGMSDEVKQHLFEPFFTTKGPGHGTGLGLAVVHGIVKQSGGHIAVESAVGQGTCFSISLPTIDQGLSADDPEETAATPLPRGEGTVLLVEDDPSVRAFAQLVLEQCGYQVLEACQADDAEAIAAMTPVDLLITDVVMPGLGGRALADRLAARHPRMKILYVSGYTDDAVVRHGVMHDQVNFLQKPFSPRTLAEKVREVYASRTRAPQSDSLRIPYELLTASGVTTELA